jgi:hypothetical protein
VGTNDFSMHFNNEIYHFGYALYKMIVPCTSQNDISFCSHGQGKKQNKIALL